MWVFVKLDMMGGIREKSERSYPEIEPTTYQSTIEPNIYQHLEICTTKNVKLKVYGGGGGGGKRQEVVGQRRVVRRIRGLMNSRLSRTWVVSRE